MLILLVGVWNYEEMTETETKEAETEYTYVIQLYHEFMDGDCEIGGRSINDIIVPTGEAASKGTRKLIDAVSKYDFEGNKIGTYRLVEENVLEEGWYLSELLCERDEVTAFYVNEDADELYISQIDIE